MRRDEVGDQAWEDLMPSESPLFLPALAVTDLM